MDLTRIVVAVERSNISSEYRAFVVKAVQEYVKQLEQAQAIKPRQVVEPIVEQVVPVVEPVIVEVKPKRTRRTKAQIISQGE